MKKSLLLLTLFIACHSAFSQLVQPVKIDSSVTVSLPKDFTQQDTLGEKIFSANSLLGYILVIRTANPQGGKPLKKEKDLEKVLKSYQNKVLISAAKGNVVHDHDTVINNNLVARDFTLQTDTGSGTQNRQFRIVYTKAYTYIFQYLYDNARKEVADKEIKAFFNSITFAPGIDREDQYSIIGQFTGMHKALKMGLIGGGLLIILLIAFLISRRRKRIN